MSTIPTCAVRSTFRDSVGGEPIANGTITAKLSSYEIYEGFVVPSEVIAKSDENGEFVLDLFPNELGSASSFYDIKIIAPNGKTLRTVAVVPNLETVELSEISETPPYEGKPDGAVVLSEVIAARTATKAWRDEAQAAAGAALESEGMAISASQAAHEFRDQAEGYEFGANVAKGIAEGSAADAMAAATSASNAATQAEATLVTAAKKLDLADPAVGFGADMVANAVRRVPTIAALLALPAPVRATTASVDGYYAANDGGGGPLTWDAASTLPTNPGSVLVPNGHVGPGRWVFSGVADIRRYGAKPDDPAFNNLAAFKASLATSGVIQLNAGGYYNVVIASDVDTISGRVEIQFNGPAIRHSASTFVLFNIVNNRLTMTGVAKFIYAGTYAINDGNIGRYGESARWPASYCGFIRCGGVSVVNIDRIEVVGETDANLYDFIFRGAQGSFYGSKIGSIFASHYSRAIADSTVGMQIGACKGTKRHNNSMQHYGQGHFAYCNLINARIDSINEYGPIIQGPSGLEGFDATLAVTAFFDSYVGEVITTMDNTTCFTMRETANNWEVGKIVSRSEGFEDREVNLALVDIQPNWEAVLLNGKIGSCTVYLPTSAVNYTGFWSGGSGLAADVVVISPDAGVVRSAAIASISTTAKSKIKLRTVCERTDDFIHVAKSINNDITIDHAGKFAEARSGPNMDGSTWGASYGNTIEFSGTIPLSGPAKVVWLTNPAEEAMFNVVRSLSQPVASYAEQRLQAGVTTASVQFPVRVTNKSVAYTNDRVNAYRLYATANDQNGLRTGYAEYRVIVRNDGTATPVFEIQQIYAYSSGGGSDTITFSLTGSAGILTLGASMAAASVFGITGLLERVSHLSRLN